jgi:predicted nucleotidyltransferase
VNHAVAVELVREAWSDVQAVYVFGSHARGDAGPASDLDVAVLTRTAIDPIVRWEVQERIASALGRAVDVVDLRAASAVMRVMVLGEGHLIFDGARAERELFEATALSDYARLQDERRAILEQVARDGHVYG